MGEFQIINAAVLVIGDEILSGRTQDVNVTTIARFLAPYGIDLAEARFVPDVEAEIVAAVNALKRRYTYVFTTGGIGPTHDDITADAVAKAFGVPIDIHPEARALMQESCDRRGIELTASRLRMARIPEGGKLVRNSVSVAPGFLISNVVVMAGVPSIMRVMLDDVTQYLQRGIPVLSHTIEVLHPEGAIADLFREHAANYPDVAMGSYPQNTDGRYWTQLVLRSTDSQRLDKAVTTLKATLAERQLTAS
jgi:molybdenum cofactor synthesis domain-containing protein